MHIFANVIRFLLNASQDFAIDENATTISFPPGCIAPANSAGLAKALSTRRRAHVTAVDLQVCLDNPWTPVFTLRVCNFPLSEQPAGRCRMQAHTRSHASCVSDAAGFFPQMLFFCLNSKARCFVSPKASLQMLNLSSCGIGKEGATSVCGVFHLLRFMKSLVLSRNAIPSDALATIARSLSSRRSLELLDLSSTGAGDAGAHALLPLLQSAGCPRELNLKDNAIGSSGAAKLLCAASSSHMLQVLDLSNNAIDDSVRHRIFSGVQYTFCSL
jgi:hypothetical protein